MPVDRRKVLTRAAPVVWTAWLLLPVESWGRLDGVPVGAFEAAALTAIWWLWCAGRAVPGGVWLPAALLAVKAIAALAIVPHGLDATYFANASWTAPHERSIGWPAGPITRRDARLAFAAQGGPELPLHFFHDNGRFNVGTRAEREGLPFSIVWTGYWRVQAPAVPRLYIEGEHLAAAIVIDGRVAVEKPADVAAVREDVPIAAGWRHLVVRVAAPHGLARAFEAGAIDEQGVRHPLGARDVFPAPVGRGARAWDARARAVASAVDAGVVTFIGLWSLLGLAVVARTAIRPAPPTGPGRGAAILALAASVALADAWWFGRQVEGRVLLLLGGDDMLTYATLARDIALNGPMMLLGQPLGEAAPFYYQPLYPYVIALTHVVFGEDGFGIFFVQRLGVWVTLLAVWRTGARLFGTRAGWVTLAAATVFVAVKVRPWSGVLLGEVVFMPLLSLCAWALVAVPHGAGLRAGVAAGVAGGLATLGRSTLLPAWALVIPLVAVARRRAGLRPGPIVVVALLVAGVVGLATLRNHVAASRFVLVTTSFANNFYLGNPPPPGTSMHDHAIFRWLAVEDPTRLALEGAWHAPGAFATNLGRKALYTLGFFDAYLPGRGWSPLLVVTWVVSLAGVVMACRRGGRRNPALWVPLAFAVTHAAAVTVIFPHAHGDRLILPFYVMLLPYVGAAFSPSARRVTGGTEPGAESRKPTAADSQA